MKTWQSNLFSAVVGVLSTIILLSVIYLVSRQPQGKPIELLPAPTQAPIVVQVVGAVANPGVYTLAPGSRVQDAVEAAGGFLAGADPSRANLAARVKDGEKINILDVEADIEPSATGSEDAGETSRSESIPASQFPIDINHATIEELDTLPGIGATKAKEIIRYREEHGGFHSIEELKEVQGIADGIFEQIKDYITVEP